MIKQLTAFAAVLAFATSSALAQSPPASYIVTTDGNLCPAETVCSPIDAGDGSAGFLHVSNPKDGFGYIAIQFGDNPPTEGFLEFLLSSAPTVQQYCAFNPGHSARGFEWPIASQIEWWSSQAVGGRFATTVKYRAHDLVPHGVYAFTFDCSVKATSP
jgi:hypothetical protein